MKEWRDLGLGAFFIFLLSMIFVLQNHGNFEWTFDGVHHVLTLGPKR